MLKKLFKFILVIIVLLCLIFGGIGYFIYTQQDTIQERLLVELNSNLFTKVQVNGPIELSLLSHFPYAALKLEDVVIMGSSGLPSDTLISAMSLYLSTSVFDLLNQNWSIREVDLRHGWMHMIRHEDGSINYQFVAKSKPTDTLKVPTPFLLRIETANLEDIHFIYTDHPASTYLDIQAYQLNFNGDFTPEKLALNIKGVAKTNQIQIKDTDYAPEQNISVTGRLELAPQENTYNLQTEELKIGQNNFRVGGSFTILKNGTAFDLTIDGIDLELAQFISLLPDNVNEHITGYQPGGLLDFSTSIFGELTNVSNPRISIEYQLVDGRIVHPESNIEIEEFVLRGNFNNGDKQLLATSNINIEKLVLGAINQQLTGSITVFNLNTPQLSAQLNGKIDLSIFKPLIADSIIQEFSGVVTVNNLSYNGPLYDLVIINHTKPTPLKFDGRFENVIITTPDVSIGIVSGHTNISPWTIQLDTLAISIDEQNLLLNGIIKDWKGYVFSLFNESEEPIKPLNIDLVVGINQFTFENKTDSSQTTDTSSFIPNHILNAEGKLRLNATAINYAGLSASNIQADISLMPQMWTINSLTANMFDGGVNVSGYVTSNLHFSAIGNVYNINISRLFESFDNFDQEDLTGNNISGKLKSTFSLTGSYFNGIWNDDVFYLLADIEIKDGTLTNYKPLEALGKFIKVEELRNIEFETMKNQIEIKEKKVHIPQMIIKSSAINLSLSGTHGFDNIVDYSIKLNIYDLLAKKFRTRNPNNQFYDVVDDNSFNFFISVKGPLDDPTIKYDKQGVKDRFKRQGGELQNAIRGVYDEYNTDKERRDWEIPEEDEFLDWNDTIP